MDRVPMFMDVRNGRGRRSRRGTRSRTLVGSPFDSLECLEQIVVASAATGNTARAGAAALTHGGNGSNGSTDQIAAEVLNAVADRSEELHSEAEELTAILRRARAHFGGQHEGLDEPCAARVFRGKDQMTEAGRAAQLIATQMATEGAAPGEIEAALTSRFGADEAETLLVDLASRARIAAA